jgi:phosphoserine aminotransferase
VEAQRDLLALPGAGMSILEISHRSPRFDEIILTAEADIAKLLGLSSDYQVLFLQGGASQQFSMVPMNFMHGKSADYVNSGSWAKKAMKEAKKEGEVAVIWSGDDEKFSRMPDPGELEYNQNAAYVHITANETIEGIEWHMDPDTGNIPLVCDASSDFMSRPIEANKYSLIYAGAQKNAGPAGVTIVIIRKDMLEEQVATTLPTMLDYKIMAENKSLYNTPTTFGIYIIGLVAKWLINDIGGLPAMHKLNKEKGGLIYDAIDTSGGYYRGHSQPQSRSLMNITFRLPSEDLEKQFVKEAKELKMDGLKGHRSVGGIRASVYNAFPIEGCKALVDFMKEFKRKNG